jgi:hypothetical protein
MTRTRSMGPQRPWSTSAVGPAAYRFVTTVRTGETAPEPIDAIWRDGLAVDVALSPLDRAASDESISEMMGDPAPGLSIRCGTGVVDIRCSWRGARSPWRCTTAAASARLLR